MSDELCSATIAQWEAAGRNSTQAALNEQLPRATFQHRLREAMARRGGVEPSTDTAEGPPREGLDPYVIKGVSTYYDANGDKRGEWVKTALDKQLQADAIRASLEALAEPLRGMGPLVPAPVGTDDDLLVVYPMGDPHFGLYAWADETGDDFDLDEAERVTCAAIDRLVATAPNATHATLLNLGDFYHADDSTNATPGHGNRLDVDTRYIKVMRVGAKAMRWCILRLLEKHQTVRVRNVPGNHDPHASFALAMALDAWFDGNPRVTVDMSPASHSYQVFGLNLIGEHHGDMTKPGDLLGVMATDRAQDWGNTTFRVWHCGHVHHDSVKEFPGVTVETHQTLAGKDAWHAAKGYRSRRSMKAVTYHREFGEVHRSRCDIAMLRGAA
jgi:hypothetical protein